METCFCDAQNEGLGRVKTLSYARGVDREPVKWYDKHIKCKKQVVL